MDLRPRKEDLRPRKEDLRPCVTMQVISRKKEKLIKTAVQVSLTDPLVAILAGFIIFPEVFSFGMDPNQGVGLLFISLTAVFSQMPMGQYSVLTSMSLYLLQP